MSEMMMIKWKTWIMNKLMEWIILLYKCHMNKVMDLWHTFFGLPRSNNYINVFERSHVFNKLAEGRAPAIHYFSNGHDYIMGYCLADGIYPKWTTFVKTIPAP